LQGLRVVDVGCGDGVLSEGLAARGASVVGIDAGGQVLQAAREHRDAGSYRIDYELATAEQYATDNAGRFDVVTCMELLEHVPAPDSVINACAALVRPGGHLFFSTINRNWKAYAGAVLAGEYLLSALPRGTHDYANFIKPSELATWCRAAGVRVKNISGMEYNPFSTKAALTRNPSINYLLYALAP
jgi:2-polyprenyl-6-hydroxyphenyl methylase/3-demethylubiquinone-9 3-methyltransferase